jgi:Tfp pilus assembly protein PilZ
MKSTKTVQTQTTGSHFRLLRQWLIVLICLVSGSLPPLAEAQSSWEWARSAGGSSDDVANATAVDAAGNVYVSGTFSDIADFGNTTLTSYGDFDIFLAKYSIAGNLVWVRQMGGASRDHGYGVAVDASGHVYQTGVFQATAAFGDTTLTSHGDFDVFVAKCDSEGNLLWITQAGGSTWSFGLGIAADGTGNGYVTGFFTGATDFSGTTLVRRGERDIYLAKYNNVGELLWVKQGGGDYWDQGHGLAVDQQDNIYVTGLFWNTATFDSGVSLTSKSSRGQASILPISLDQTSMILLEVAPCRDNCASNIPAPSTT